MMYKVMITIVVAVFVLAPLRASAKAPEVINLGDRRFNASGQGNVTTIGSIAQADTALNVDNPTTWRVGHGVRVRRAGGQSLVHTADAGWVVPPTIPAGAVVAHDKLDKIEGSASVRCTFSGTPPDADGDGRPGPVDICEVDVGGPIDTAFDELRFWVKSSAAIKGNLQLRVLGADRAATFELAVPVLGADK
jgi:hypothetical protein